MYTHECMLITQYIMVGDWSDHSQADRVLRVADSTTALVDDFKYLGSWMSCMCMKCMYVC